MVRAIKPKNITSSFLEIPKKLSQAEPSLWKHVAREPNFKLSISSTQPLGLGLAKARPEIWPVGHGFWLARPGPDCGWPDPAWTKKIALLAEKLAKFF